MAKAPKKTDDEKIAELEKKIESFSGKILSWDEAKVFVNTNFALAVKLHTLRPNDFNLQEKEEWNKLKDLIFLKIPEYFAKHLRFESWLLSPFYTYHTEPRGLIKLSFLGGPSKNQYLYVEYDDFLKKWRKKNSSHMETPEMTQYVTQYRARRKKMLKRKLELKNPNIMDMVAPAPVDLTASSPEEGQETETVSDPDPEFHSGTSPPTCSKPKASCSNAKAFLWDGATPPPGYDGPCRPCPPCPSVCSPSGMIVNCEMVLPENLDCNCITTPFSFVKGNVHAPGKYRLVVFDTVVQREKFCQQTKCKSVQLQMLQ